MRIRAHPRDKRNRVSHIFFLRTFAICTFAILCCVEGTYVAGRPDRFRYFSGRSIRD
jgi:hypothetical protein